MGVYSLDQIKDIIVKNPNADIVQKARKMRALYSKHTHSVGYKESIKRDPYVEDDACFNSRKSSAISNRDLFKRVLNKEDQVFTTSGGSAFFGLEKSKEDQMNALIDNVIYGMNLHKWVHTYALPAYRADPMSVICMEADEVQSVDGINFTTPKCYPTYKSSDDIYDYQPNGRNLEYVCFLLTQDQMLNYGLIEARNNSDFMAFVNGNGGNGYYRFVDDANDIVVKVENKTLTICKLRQANPINHNFGKTPGFINSDLFQYDDPKAFGSPLQFVIEIADSFLHDRSVRDLHKKLHGFPKAVEPLLACTRCSNGGVSTGLVNGNPCPDCTLPGHNQGTGYKLKTTPADVARFPLEMLKDIPRFKASDIFMYITPDVQGLEMMNIGLVDQEELIRCTYWGTTPVRALGINGKQSLDETATKTLTDLQPEYARLNMTADWAENTMKNVANFIGKFWFPEVWKDNQANIILSRNYILELPETILEVYHTMLKNNTPDVELDNQFKRYLMALYKSNPDKLAVAIKFYELQPFPHKTDAMVSGNADISIEDKAANSYFGEWMRTLNDYQKQQLSKEALSKLFKTWLADKIAAVTKEKQQALVEPNPN